MKKCSACFEPCETTPLCSKHPMCVDCLKQWVASCVSRGQLPVPCAARGSGCSACLENPLDLQPILSDDEWTALLDALASKAIQTAKDGMFCPQPGCGVGFLASMPDGCSDMTCHECEHTFCTHCFESAHPGATCAEASGSAHGVHYGMSTFDYVAKFAKACPKCALPQERNGGCNVHTCGCCGAVYCWACQRPFGGPQDEHRGCYDKVMAEDRAAAQARRAIRDRERAAEWEVRRIAQRERLAQARAQSAEKRRQLQARLEQSRREAAEARAELLERRQDLDPRAFVELQEQSGGVAWVVSVN